LHWMGSVQPFADLADILGSNVNDHLQLDRADIQLLRCFRPHAYQRRSAATNLLALGNVMHHLLAKKIRRQGSPPAFGSLVSRDLDRCFPRRGYLRCVPDFIEENALLLLLFGESLASTTEDLVAEKPQFLLQHRGSAAEE